MGAGLGKTAPRRRKGASAGDSRILSRLDRRQVRAQDCVRGARVPISLGNFADRSARHGYARRARIACRERGVFGVNTLALWRLGAGGQKIQTWKVEREVEKASSRRRWL